MKKSDQVQNIFNDLYEILKNRKITNQPSSYTHSLLKKGSGEICKKFGEEAIETVIAALSEKKQNVVNESADVLYHLFVLWVHLGIELGDVENELKRRFGTSGLVEKKNRRLLK